MAKNHKGTFPDPDLWDVIGRTGGWVVVKKRNGNGSWIPVKVLFDGIIKGRANFWIGWNGNRIPDGREVSQMDRDHPGLSRGVIRILSSHSE
jgi:hypothetical protein